MGQALLQVIPLAIPAIMTHNRQKELRRYILFLTSLKIKVSTFYFISDDELLSVLGSSDPTSIQVHMLKLFDNVKELKFGC